MKYEVVCTKRYLDIGLLIEQRGFKPKRVLARASTYSDRGSEYGGVETVDWIRTGVFLSESEWNKITCDKPTNQILDELGINRTTYKDDEEMKKDYDMEDTMIRASRKAGLTRNQLIDTLFEEGVLAVYNLGMKHMYEYLEDK